MAQLSKSNIPGIKNYTQFSGVSEFAGPEAGFGGATEAAAMPKLKELGFSSVINLRVGSEENADVDGSRSAADAAGLKYFHLPLDVKNPAPDLLEKLVASAANPTNRPFYLHCGSATRVAALWMAARVKIDGLDIDQAQEEVRSIAAKPDDAIAFGLATLNNKASSD